MSFCIVFIITGSIARSATRRYLSYSEADFEVFRPAGATRCTDGIEIWHGRGKRRSPPPCQISTPSVQRPSNISSLYRSLFPFLDCVDSIRGFAHAAGFAAVRRCLRFLVQPFIRAANDCPSSRTATNTRLGYTPS